MRETKDENRRPYMKVPLTTDQESAISSVCPEISSTQSFSQDTLTEAAWGPVLEVWQGHATDEEIRFRGSSGGATTALALYALEESGFEGVLHVKSKPEKPIENQAAISRNRTELLVGSGSRYGPASVCDQLPQVKAADGKCVVIGKPCDIRGVEAVCQEKKNKLSEKIGLTLAIFCAGTPSQTGTKALLARLGARPGRSLVSLKYRGNGWPGNMVATWRESETFGRYEEVSYAIGWGDILQKFRQWRCHVCEDHTGEYADISIGDPWQTPAHEDAKGSSLIIVRTERGRKFLRNAMRGGYIRLERKLPEVLFDAQPNLFMTKGAVWGRKLALRLMLQKTSTMTAASFRCWRALSIQKKVQSIAGTLKRVISRRLYRAKETNWVDGRYSS